MKLFRILSKIYNTLYALVVNIKHKEKVLIIVVKSR
jgi:hypothetical protein